MRKFSSVLLVACLLLLAACAGVQEKWDKLTPDEQARVVINNLQGQLENAFVSAKTQIGTKPEWKTKAVPAFDLANKTLARVIEAGKTTPLTPAFVYAQVQGLVNDVLNLCTQLGWVKK